jgi:hypothetical protein
MHQHMLAAAPVASGNTQEQHGPAWALLLRVVLAFHGIAWVYGVLGWMVIALMRGCFAF